MPLTRDPGVLIVVRGMLGTQYDGQFQQSQALISHSGKRTIPGGRQDGAPAGTFRLIPSECGASAAAEEAADWEGAEARSGLKSAEGSDGLLTETRDLRSRPPECGFAACRRPARCQPNPTQGMDSSMPIPLSADDKRMAGTFAARFASARSRYGPLVWGLDPAGSLLRAWGAGDTPAGLERFADIVLSAATGTVGLVKVQAACYERHGWRGFRSLQRLIAAARSAGLLVIVDAKRGDVGSTNEAYAEAFLGKDAPLAADALTVHPYLGLGAMDSFVARAHESGSCLLVVTRSSNPEGRPIQAAVTVTGRSVEAELLAGIGQLNAKLAPGAIGPIGAVVGPTHMAPDLDLVAAHGLFLAPGVGAQGATPRDVAQVFAACPDRVMPSASRTLLGAGPEVSRLRDTAANLAGAFRETLGS